MSPIQPSWGHNSRADICGTILDEVPTMGVREPGPLVIPPQCDRNK